MSEITIVDALHMALAHHKAGKLAEAEGIYRQVLEQHPNEPDTLHLLGTLIGQSGRMEEAVHLLRRAIAVAPERALYATNLGRLYMQAGRPAEAAEMQRQAVRITPEYTEAHLELGFALEALGDLDGAIAAYSTAVRQVPEESRAQNRLGKLLHLRGRMAEAKACFEEALFNDPLLVDARINMGILFESQGLHAEALEQYRQALVHAPQSALLHYNMGVALTELGRTEEALAAYRQATILQPDSFAAFNNMGNALKILGRFDEAIAAYGRALALKGDLAEAYSNLAALLESRAEHAGALACNRRAVELRPGHALTHSNLVRSLLYMPQYDEAMIKQELRIWNERHAVPLRPFRRPLENSRAPERRLRIGYVSGDFCGHVVGWNILPALRERDRSAFEAYCYSNLTRKDEFTERFERMSDGWRDIVGMTDEEVAERIRADGIDILVDLSLHTAGNRLTVLARQPAPVQATFAGYPGSTGLETMDYRLTDPYLDPAEHEGPYVERSIRLPASFWCYDPPGGTAAPNALPAAANGYVTFGCLNHFCKVNQDVLGLWSEVMAKLPGSRLMLLSAEGSHRQKTLDFFAARGIAAGRIEFCTSRPREPYLELYHRIDLGLDTLPYNGHTTSLDSLWMGVPVVTQVGRTVVGRAGYSQLMNVGMPELIAQDRAAFVRVATELAGDLARLKEYRATLRKRMEGSPLMDAKGFARGIEGAYRQMWRTWCAAGTEKLGG